MRGFSSEEEALSDKDVLSRLPGEPDLFRLIVRRYEAAFMRKALSILRVPEDAEEVVQDAFTRIYLYADRYERQEGATFSSWAYTILTRLAFTRYQAMKKRRAAAVPLDPEVYESIRDTADFVEELSIKSEVTAALASLPETASRVLRLQFLEGKTQEETAEAEDSTVSAVKARVHRAKKLFKETYDDQHAD